MANVAECRAHDNAGAGIAVSGSYRSVGFGTLEQRVNERSKEDFLQYDATTNLDLGKLVPKSAGLQIPVYAGISKTISKPKYDPLDLDIELNQKLKSAQSGHDADSIRAQAVDETTIKTVNFTNVKKNKTNGKKPQPWDISNIDLNYNYVHQQRTSPVIELEDIMRAITIMEPHFELLDKQRQKDNDRGNAKPTIEKIITSMLDANKAQIDTMVKGEVKKVLDKM